MDHARSYDRMTIPRGNRKLAALAMSLIALVLCTVAMVAMQADPALFASCATAIAALHGSTVYGNIREHAAIPINQVSGGDTTADRNP